MVRGSIDRTAPRYAPAPAPVHAPRPLHPLTAVLAAMGDVSAMLVGCGAPDCPEGVTPDPAGNCPIVDDTSPTATP